MSVEPSSPGEVVATRDVSNLGVAACDRFMRTLWPACDHGVALAPLVLCPGKAISPACRPPQSGAVTKMKSQQTNSAQSR